MVLSSAGDHDPVIPLIEVVGRAANGFPAQIVCTWVKFGMLFGITVIVIVAVVAHCPVSGVNV